MVDGLVPDIMHDVLEGCAQYEVKELLKCDRACEKGALAALSRFVQYTKISIELIVGDN